MRRRQLQRSGGSAQAVRLERRGVERSRIEVQPDALEAAGRVEHEDGEQLPQIRFVEDAQRIPNSWPAAIASARRFTPSFS